MKKVDFIKVVNGMNKENEIESFDITIWHEGSEIYTEVLVNGNEPFTYGEIENWYEGETIEDTEENISKLLKDAKKIEANIIKWIKGTCFQGTKIVIKEENI
jgi:hypothetical protein